MTVSKREIRMKIFDLFVVTVFITVLVGHIKSCSKALIPQGSLNISEH